MSSTVLIIDCQVPYSRGEARHTLLTMPLAHSTVLEQQLEALGDLVEKDVWVMLPVGNTPEYIAQIHAAASRPVKVLSVDEVSALLAQAEPSDQLLIVQSRHWLLGGYDAAELKREFREYRGATFGVAIGEDSEGARELVIQDASGRVRRVQRLYNAVSWPESASSAVPFALIPARSGADLLFESLTDLRNALSRRGVLTNDLPLQSDTLDLTRETEFLALSEQLTSNIVRRATPPAGYRLHAPGVLVAEKCNIHPRSRLIGPVIVQADSEIEEDVTVVGPSVIGRGSHILAKTTLAQAVVLPATTLSEASTVRHCIASENSIATVDSAVLAFGRDDPVLGSRYLASDQGSGPPILQGKILHLVAKRALDIVSASLALIALAPLLVAIALLVKLDSPGPIFFSHRRERKGGKEFPCIKFRTMVYNAHHIQRELYQNNEVDGPQFKMRNDPRVTRVGRWLRGTNVDELPQLINVLVGHMSLVGPRPSPFRENQICVPWRRARLSVRPGITGLWQICRDDVREADFHQWIYYDIAYVRNFSFWLDLKLLIATILTLGGRTSVPLAWFLPAARRSSIHPQPAAA